METITHFWLQNLFRDDYVFILNTIRNLLNNNLPPTAILLKGKQTSNKKFFKEWLYDLLKTHLFISPEIVNIIFIETDKDLQFEDCNIPIVNIHQVEIKARKIIQDKMNFILAEQ